MLFTSERSELLRDTVLMLGNIECRILETLGEGTSCIVYKAQMRICMDGQTLQRTVVLKELYPKLLEITRKADHSLDIPEGSQPLFDQYMSRFKRACQRQIELHNDASMTNAVTEIQHIYSLNNTLYSVMGIVTGDSYEKERPEDLRRILNVGMSLAHYIARCHERGFLYLDIKPANILNAVLPGDNVAVRLFDFDTVVTKEEAQKGDVSYSEGYAAPEVKKAKQGNGSYADIREQADLFSIGSVIFEKIMGRCSKAEDHSKGKRWDFSHNPYLRNAVPQLQKGITEFFRKTLARDANNRYASAQELKEVLEKLMKLADIKVFLKKQKIAPCTPKSIYMARTHVLFQIAEKLKENHLLYLYAIGGSGKSETAREYAQQYAKQYNFIQDIFYSGNLKKTIANLDFVGLKDEDRFAHTDEEIDRLYKYKYGLLGNTAMYGDNTLLIIDNYDYDPNPESEEYKLNTIIIRQLEQLPIHVLFTTRRKPSDSTKCLDLLNLSPEELRELFFRINPTAKNKSDSIELVDKIIEVSYYHTMTVKIVAMQSAKYRKPLSEYLEILTKSGLNSGIKGRLTNEKDGEAVTMSTVYEHIKALFDFEHLSELQKYIMVNACLLPLSGLETGVFSDFIGLSGDCLDPNIEDLINSGWIEYADTAESQLTAETKITLHPLIGDLVRNELQPELTEDKCRKFYISFLDTIEYWSSNLNNSIFKDIIIAIYNNITKIYAIKTHINYEYLTKSINYLLMSSPGEYIVNNYCLILKKYNRLICYYGINDNCKVSSDVKSIAKNAFANSHYLVHIEIPNTITVINEGCFNNCTSLVNIIIPDSVYSICDDAFLRCVSLTNVTLSKKLTDIGKLAFGLCKSLSDIIIPDNVNTIGSGAFAYCSNLKHVVLPEKVIKIANGLFKGCISLESIKLSYKTLSIYDFAFENCSNLSEINLPNNMKYISENAFNGCSKLKNDTCELLKKWQLPSSKSNITEYSGFEISEVTKNIKPKQFYNNTNLKNIKITIGVKKIGYSAFEGCSSLTEIHIPDSVKKIELSAFQNCTNLEKIFLPIKITKIGHNLFRGCKSLRYLKIGNQNPTDHILKLPNSIIKIEDHAFEDCQSLTSVFIPDSVKLMGYSVFRDCTSLVSAKLPQYCHVLSDGIFSGCISLEYILLPTDLEVIGHHAFCKCAFTEIELPDSVRSIGEGAFENSHLIDISLPENINFLGQNAFKNCFDLKHIILPDYIESIYDSTFESCAALMDIKLPEKLMEIGKFAFKDCISLQRISIPDRLEILDDAAFESCKSIQQLFIPCSVLDIGINTFFNCESLNEITFLCAGTSLENSGLGYFKSKTNNLYHKNESLVIKGYKGSKAEQYAVEHGFKFVCIKYEIPDGVIKIKDYLFSGCKSLKKIHIPESVRFIGEYAFSNCDLLDEINIPNSVTSIDQFAFRNCRSLREINIPDSVESIEFMAFAGCVSLEKIRFPSGLIIISPCAFEGCFSLTNVIIPPNVKYIGYNAFSYSTLSKITFLNDKAYTASDGIDISESRIGYYESNNKDTYIKKYVKNENLIIEGYKGSTAEQYAQEHGFKFVPLD